MSEAKNDLSPREIIFMKFDAPMSSNERGQNVIQDGMLISPTTD